MRGEEACRRTYLGVAARPLSPPFDCRTSAWLHVGAGTDEFLYPAAASRSKAEAAHSAQRGRVTRDTEKPCARRWEGRRWGATSGGAPLVY